jgi:hypothetical protein
VEIKPEEWEDFKSWVNSIPPCPIYMSIHVDKDKRSMSVSLSPATLNNFRLLEKPLFYFNLPLNESDVE